MGLIEEQKIQLPVTITGTYIANNCDELHAFQSTSGKVIGNMNVIVGKKLEEIYNSGINPKPIEVIVKVNNMTVSWSVTIDKSNDNKAWVGFTSRGAGCNNDVINRANSEIAGNDIETLKVKILNTYGENNIYVEEVNDFIYQNQNNGFRQIFYRYTKPKSFPSLESGKKEISINESPNKSVIDLFELDNNINENYTTWVKRRMDMVQQAERGASSYMVRRFKQNPKQYTKSKFTHMFFSIMMDELHDELSNGGTQDFDYSKVHQEIRDSFKNYVEELWKDLNNRL